MFWNQMFMIVVGVVCGSMLFGSYLPKKIKNIDVTALSDDHNPGTANAMKYAGVPVGIMCLVADLLKGALPIYISIQMGLVSGSLFPLVMAAPVIGHAYSLFHHGKGGKAIAVSFGVLIGLSPVHYQLLLMLCVIYITCSVIIVINPHPKRTRVTYAVFSLGAVALMMFHIISFQICCGAVFIAGIVIHKNKETSSFGNSLENI